MLQKLIHKLPAGLLPGDQSIEILADRETRKLFFIQNGSVYSFKDLSNAYKRQLLVKLLADKPALKDLGYLGYSKALEEFAFCLFGGADSNPDFDEDGKLGVVENFRCGLNCRCLSWKSKKITYNKNSVTKRELQVLDLLKLGDPDKLIAHKLKISMSTLNTHKKNIMNKFGASSKTSAVVHGIENHIIQ